MRQLVLASTSRYRAAVLARLGRPFVQAAPDCDEDAAARLETVPSRLVWSLAREKAWSVAARFPDALVLGGDQLAVLGDEVLGKPGTPERAQAQLERLSGQTHRLLTAVALVDPGAARTLVALDVHHLRMRRLSRAEIEAYVARDLPLDCAGSYRVEGAGPQLFECVRGDDPSAIEGLPLGRVAHLLRTLERST